MIYKILTCLGLSMILFYSSSIAKNVSQIHHVTPEILAKAMLHPDEAIVVIDGKNWVINKKESCGRFFNKDVDPKLFNILKSTLVKPSKDSSDEFLIVTFEVNDKINPIETHTMYFRHPKKAH